MGKPIYDKIAVVGYDMTEFGDLYDMGIADMSNLAINGALKSAGIESSDIDALYVGNAGSGQFLGQEHLGCLIASESGIFTQATSIEASGASGAAAMRIATHGIFTGYMNKVAVVGVEKMTSLNQSRHTQEALATSLDTIWESSMGATLPGNFAMMAKAHMRKYGTTKEQMAQVAVKNHDNARLNPRAQFRNKLRIESVLGSKKLADPINIFESCAASDGAAAIVMMAPDIAESYVKEPIFLRACYQTHDYMALHQRPNLHELRAVRTGAEKAYKQLGITAKDISFSEVHDVFTIAEIMAIEALGLVEPGKGGIATEEGRTALRGDIPVNTSGGLKARGYPIGASGIAQIIEVMEQFEGIAGDRQIEDPQWGLAQSIGGSGGTSVVSVFSR
ncbi:MAG: thiolase domain-containing protein [Candidatus Heimdallarchaeota archaeon]|nr:thiolase domain-containing protein [Candidatus Heimdallarchaeota archaeon]